jgi:hypothetical protein
MTSAQPESTRGPGRQDSPGFKPGVEIRSSNFVVRLSTRSRETDSHVCFEIYLLCADGSRDRLQYASSTWLTELVDNLNLVEIKIKRDGVDKEPQVLGRKVGVSIFYRHDEATGKETSTAKLLIEGDGHWHHHLGESFDASLIPELRQLTSDALNLMREEALPELKGLGFKFNVT